MAGPEQQWTLEQYNKALDLLQSGRVPEGKRPKLEAAVRAWQDSALGGGMPAGMEETEPPPSSDEPAAVGASEQRQAAQAQADLGAEDPGFHPPEQQVSESISAPDEQVPMTPLTEEEFQLRRTGIEQRLATGPSRPPEFWGEGASSYDEIGVTPYVHEDPPVEEAMNALDQIAEQAPPENQEAISNFMADLAENGEHSEFYRRYADNKWAQVYDAFKNRGAPVLRRSELSYGDALEDPHGVEDGSAYGRLSSMVANDIAGPMLGGLDAMATFGMGREALASAAGNELVSLRGRAGEALDALEGQGVVQDLADRTRESMREHPVPAILGGIGGLTIPGIGGALGKAGASASRGINRAAFRAMPNKVSGAQGLGRIGTRILGNAAVGAAEGAIGAGGEELVHQAGEAFRGDEASLDPVGEAAQIGAVTGGVAGGALSELGHQIGRRQGAYRSTTPIGQRLKPLEDVGGGSGLTATGLRPTHQIQDWVDRAATERAPISGIRAMSPSDIAAKDVSENVVDSLANRERQVRQVMKVQEQKWKKAHKGKSGRPTNAFRVYMDALENKQGALFKAESGMAQHAPKLMEVADVGLMPDPKKFHQLHGAAKVIPVEDAAALGLGRQVLKKANVSGGIDSLEGLSVVVIPRRQSSEQLKESLRYLDDEIINWESRSDSTDPVWGFLREALAEDRKAIFGRQYTRVKSWQHDQLKSMAKDARAFTGRTSAIFDPSDDPQAMTQAFGSVRGLRDRAWPERREIHESMAAKFPEASRQLKEMEGLHSYMDITGDVTQNRAASAEHRVAGRALSRLPLWWDAISDIRRPASFGGALGAPTAQALSETPTDQPPPQSIGQLEQVERFLRYLQQ